jgi:beta-lactamase class A
MEKISVLTKLENLKVDYAFYYHDKVNPPVFVSNQSLFRSASIIKVPILLAWLALEKDGVVDRTRKCRLDDEVQVGGAGFARQFATRTLAFADVLLMMIATSDNLCTNIVLQEMGLERLQTVMQEALGLQRTRCERKLMDYAARERGLDNYIDAGECIQLFRMIDQLPEDDRTWVRSLLLANTDSALLMRDLPRDTIDFYHKTGSMNGVLHDWGFTDACEIFLFTQKVTNEPAVFEIFGKLGKTCLLPGKG